MILSHSATSVSRKSRTTSQPAMLARKSAGPTSVSNAATAASTFARSVMSVRLTQAPPRSAPPLPPRRLRQCREFRPGILPRPTGSPSRCRSRSRRLSAIRGGLPIPSCQSSHTRSSCQVLSWPNLSRPILSHMNRLFLSGHRSQSGRFYIRNPADWEECWDATFLRSAIGLAELTACHDRQGNCLEILLLS